MRGAKRAPAAAAAAAPAADALPACVRAAPGGTLLTVRAKPGSRVAALVAVADAVELAIDAPAREGEANAALTEFLAELLGVKKRDVALHSGGKSRDKVFRVEGLAPEEAVVRLRASLEP
jgi:uncharacterized protein (TIGR00251 family)